MADDNAEGNAGHEADDKAGLTALHVALPQSVRLAIPPPPQQT